MKIRVYKNEVMTSTRNGTRVSVIKADKDEFIMLLEKAFRLSKRTDLINNQHQQVISRPHSDLAIVRTVMYLSEEALQAVNRVSLFAKGLESNGSQGSFSFEEKELKSKE